MLARCFTVVLLLASLKAALAKKAESPIGSCGVTPNADCVNDMGSCGNACCSAEFKTSMGVGEAFEALQSYLEDGGADGLFAYVGGSGGLNIPASQGSIWDSIFQGTHTTIKARYVDTLDFAIRSAKDGGSTVRAFSISNIAGALGDEGQNRRTISLMGQDLGLGSMKVLFGCGEGPSLPASKPVALEMLVTSTAATSRGLERATCIFVGSLATMVAIGALIGFRSFFGKSQALQDANAEASYFLVA